MRFSPSVRAVGRNVFYCVKNKKPISFFYFFAKFQFCIIIPYNIHKLLVCTLAFEE